MKFQREDGVIMEACNDIQASAFLSSGWKKVEEVAAESSVSVEKANAPSKAETTKPKRGRKSTTTKE